mmetsp:Transcript_20610/g.29089  ORF Transcript_20610/g.29089 Transcript_20610/m.29089 type:complete len:309 (-) Transcript_20610:1398-2324(-)
MKPKALKGPSKLLNLMRKLTIPLRSKKEALLDGVSLSTTRSDGTGSTASFENLVIPTSYAIDSDSGLVTGDETPIASKDWESSFGTRYESIDESFHDDKGRRNIRSNILIEEEGGVSVTYNDRNTNEKQMPKWQGEQQEITRSPEPSSDPPSQGDTENDTDIDDDVSNVKPLEEHFALTKESANHEQFMKAFANFDSMYNNPDANPMELLQNHIFHGHLSTLYECSSEDMSASSMAELEQALSFSQRDKIRSTIGNVDEQMVRVRWDCALRMMTSGANDTSLLFDKFSTAILGSCKENNFGNIETAEI